VSLLLGSLMFGSVALADGPDLPVPVGLLQLWGTVYDMDQDPQADASGIGDPEDDTGLKVKRARVGFQDTAGPLIYRLTLGVSAPYDGYNHEGEEIGIVDAVMGYRIAPSFVLQAGRSKVPFSRDQIIGAADLTFQERGLGAEYIVPDRALGVLGIGLFGPAKVQLGLFNSSSDLFGDDSAGKTAVLRAEAAIGERDTYAFWGGTGRGASVGFGLSGLWTDDVTTRTFAAGGDVLFRVRGLAMMIDGSWAKVAPFDSTEGVPGVLADTTRMAITTQISYSIGIVEPAVRFSGYDDSSLGQYGHILAGVVLHGGTNPAGYDRFRVGAGYELRLEEQVIPNDTVRLWTQVKF